jgi:hypothetical protein
MYLLSYFLLKCTAKIRNSIYVIPERKLRGLIPNFYIHIYVSDLYVNPTIGPPIFLQQNRQTDQGNV